MSDLTTSPFPEDFGQSLSSIGILYLFWTGSALLLHVASGFIQPAPLLSEWIVSLSILLHILLAALITAIFMARVQPGLESRHRFRGVLIFLCAGFTVSLYLYGRFVDYEMPVFMITLNTANLIVFANLVGTWMTVPLKRAAELIPVCLVMVLSDLFSVLGGPTRNIINTLQKYYQSGMTGPMPAAEFILVKVAIPGMDRPISIFGVADWIMVAFLAAAAAKFNINDNIAGTGMPGMIRRRQASFYMPVSGIGLLTAVILARNIGVFLPALPFIVLFFMSYTLSRFPEARRLTRSDWLATGGAAVVFCCLIALFHFRHY